MFTKVPVSGESAVSLAESTRRVGATEKANDVPLVKTGLLIGGGTETDVWEQRDCEKTVIKVPRKGISALDLGKSLIEAEAARVRHLEYNGVATGYKGMVFAELPRVEKSMVVYASAYRRKIPGDQIIIGNAINGVTVRDTDVMGFALGLARSFDRLEGSLAVTDPKPSNYGIEVMTPVADRQDNANMAPSPEQQRGERGVGKWIAGLVHWIEAEIGGRVPDRRSLLFAPDSAGVIDMGAVMTATEAKNSTKSADQFPPCTPYYLSPSVAELFFNTQSRSKDPASVQYHRTISRQENSTWSIGVQLYHAVDQNFAPGEAFGSEILKADPQRYRDQWPKSKDLVMACMEARIIGVKNPYDVYEYERETLRLAVEDRRISQEYADVTMDCITGGVSDLRRLRSRLTRSMRRAGVDLDGAHL